MQVPDRIMVMALKGTPACPDEEGNPPPAAFAKCAGCEADLVFDARNRARIKSEKITPMCGDCAANLVLESGRRADVQGMFKGRKSSRGVAEFVDKLANHASRRPN